MSDTLLVSVSDTGVARVVMNRPDLHNAFDDVLIADLTAIFEKLDADPAVRMVILAAEGKSFSAGADLNWMRRMAGYSRGENLADSEKLAELMRVINFLSKPTIASVQGAAFGGGVGLVACCDIAIASERASFCLSEVKLGLIPAVISPYVVEAIGKRAARRYFLTAERFGAEEAHRIGLIHHLCQPDELDAAVAGMANKLLTNGPAAMASAKDLIHYVGSHPITADLIQGTAERIADQRASDEGKEGLSAFLEKRSPNWSREA